MQGITAEINILSLKSLQCQKIPLPGDLSVTELSKFMHVKLIKRINHSKTTMYYYNNKLVPQIIVPIA